MAAPDLLRLIVSPGSPKSQRSCSSWVSSKAEQDFLDAGGAGPPEAVFGYSGPQGPHRGFRYSRLKLPEGDRALFFIVSEGGD